MRRKEEISAEELMRRVVKRPVWSYFHTTIGISDAVKETGEDMLDALKLILEGVLELVVCTGTMCKHLAILLLYPATKVYYQWKIKKRILKEYPHIAE